MADPFAPISTAAPRYSKDARSAPRPLNTVAEPSRAPAGDAVQPYSAQPFEVTPARAFEEHGPIEVLGIGLLSADPIALQKRLETLVRADGIAAVHLRVERAKAGAADYAGLSGRLGNAGASRRAATILARLGHLERGLVQLTRQRDEVRAALQPAAVFEAEQLLAASKKNVDGMRAQYLDGPDSTRELRGLRSASRELVSARGDANRALRGASFEEERRAILEGYSKTLARLADAHPILARFTLEASPVALFDLAQDVGVDAGTRSARARPLFEPIAGMLGEASWGIARMQARLQDDPSVVWALPAVVEATLIAHGVPDRGMTAALARDVVREARRDEEVWRTFVSVASIGLGIAAALPSGGTSLAVGAAATASLDAYQLYTSLEEYRFAHDAANGGLATNRPTPIGLVIDGIAAVSGVAGAGAALSKRAFTRVLARSDEVGDAARALELRVGRERAAATFARLGEEGAVDLVREVAPSVWSALGAVDRGAVDVALDTLGPERFAVWADALGAKRFATLVGRVDATTWPHLVAAPVEPEALLRAFDLGDDVVVALAPRLKGAGLAKLARHVDGAPLEALPNSAVVLHGQLRFSPFELNRIGDQGGLAAVVERWSALRALSPMAERIDLLTSKDLLDFERLIGAAHRGRPLDGALLERLAKRTRTPRATVTGVVLESSGVRLSRRALAMAEAAPELRAGLLMLEASSASSASRARVLASLKRALGAKNVEFSRPHLAGWLESATAAGTATDRMLDARHGELAYAVEVVDAGRAKAGSTMFVGVDAGDTARLAPGGPVVKLPKADPDLAGGLEDIDVLFLDARGVVQVVEVKRSAESLWQAIESSEGGKYLRKFARFREEGAQVGQTREVRVALRQEGDAALDRYSPRADDTPRNLADEERIAIEVSQ